VYLLGNTCEGTKGVTGVSFYMYIAPTDFLISFY
jgi:hypothetical protein